MLGVPRNVWGHKGRTGDCLDTVIQCNKTIRLEAIALRLEAIASKLETIASRFGAIRAVRVSQDGALRTTL